MDRKHQNLIISLFALNGVRSIYFQILRGMIFLISIHTPTISGRLQFARLLKASKTEKLQKNFQRLNSRKLLPPKLGCKDKRAFEHTFGLHPQTCADIWNHDMDKLSFKAKPKHLLATLILLKSQDDSPLYFATKPSVNEEWVQRVLKQIASLSDSNMVSSKVFLLNAVDNNQLIDGNIPCY